MKKNILVYGLISGILITTVMLLMINTISHCNGNMDYDSSMLLGYASMILGFSLVFVGIRNYRNQYSNGMISFGKAFQIGSMIVLIASTIYVLAWLIDFYFFIPDFMEKYGAHMLEQMKAKGESAAKIEEQTKELAYMSSWYKNPIMNALITYMEILPVGLLWTLVSALILKRKPSNA